MISIGAGVGKAEFSVGMGVLPPVFRGAHKRIVGIPLVELVIFVKNAQLRRFYGGDGTEKIPHYLKMVVHFPSAPHYIAKAGILKSVAGAAGDGILLKNVYAFAGHTVRRVPDSRPR